VISTATLSLDRWDIAQRRLENYIGTQRQVLTQALVPVRIDLDTRELLLPRAQNAHAKVFDLITTLDRALGLQTQIRARYRQAEVAFGLQVLEEQIQGLKNLSELLDEITDAPSRLDVLHNLEYAHKRFDSLRVAGEGDLIRTERQHLKSLTFDLPAVGHEDFVPLNEYHEQINAQLDAMIARRTEIRSSSGFHLEVEDHLASLLSKLGLQAYQVPEDNREQTEQTSSEEIVENPGEDGVNNVGAAQNAAPSGSEPELPVILPTGFQEPEVVSDAQEVSAQATQSGNEPATEESATAENPVLTQSAWDAGPARDTKAEG